MNLLHFLSVSQSFSGVKSSPSPYRIAREGWLPKFTPPADSRSATTTVWPASQAAPAIKQESPLPASRLESPRASLELKPKAAPAPARAAGQPHFHSTTRAGERLRQAELSLDAVQVVRNDLSEGAYDVVRRRPEEHVVERTSSTFAAIQRFGRRSGLNWITARFFRQGRTQI